VTLPLAVDKTEVTIYCIIADTLIAREGLCHARLRRAFRGRVSPD
jgi:hypothetical protein